MMHQTKKIILTFFLLTIISSFPTAIFAAGKIQNATMDEIKGFIDTTIERSEKVLSAIENGEDNETVLSLLNDVKQMAKEIHATKKAAVYKSKAGSQMKKARIATKKADLDTAKPHVVKGLEYYRKLKEVFPGN